jgi:hypothetical protein
MAKQYHGLDECILDSSIWFNSLIPFSPLQSSKDVEDVDSFPPTM